MTEPHYAAVAAVHFILSLLTLPLQVIIRLGSAQRVHNLFAKAISH